LTQPDRHDAHVSSSKQKERTMIALYDHIQELRAELRGCCMTRRERAALQAELARATASWPGPLTPRPRAVLASAY
jgi:hypothetical protein